MEHQARSSDPTVGEATPSYWAYPVHTLAHELRKGLRDLGVHVDGDLFPLSARVWHRLQNQYRFGSITNVQVLSATPQGNKILVRAHVYWTENQRFTVTILYPIRYPQLAVYSLSNPVGVPPSPFFPHQPHFPAPRDHQAPGQGGTTYTYAGQGIYYDSNGVYYYPSEYAGAQEYVSSSGELYLIDPNTGYPSIPGGYDTSGYSSFGD